MPIRIWDQVVGVFSPYLSLTLIHPDGRGHTHWTDLEFLEEVKAHLWYEIKDNYASSGGGENYTRFHWLPLGKPPEGMKIDHLDGNIFNSCKDNLRIKSNRGNNHNNKNHGEWGPCIFYPHHNNWRVQMQFSDNHIFKPSFTTPDQAMACRDMYLAIATAYDRKERDLPTREELKTIADKIKETY